MRDTVPVEDFLLLLRPNAVVLVEEVEEGTLGFFQRCIGTRLEVAQIRKYSLLELLRVLHRPAKSMESEREAAHDICASDVKEVVPTTC